MKSMGYGKRIACAFFALWLIFDATAGVTDIATAPLETSARSAVLPNLMFVLDDSGSMQWDFLPDWANDNLCRHTDGNFTGSCCRDSGGNGSSSYACWRGDASFGTFRGQPPFLASDFNTVYYNPAVTYTPPLNADGTSKPSQTAWTAVKNDYYNIQSISSIDLTTQFPDTEWCTDTSYTDCLRNGNYILPRMVGDKNYLTFHATTASGSGNIVNGSPVLPSIPSRQWGPHYYSMLPGEYCDNVNLRNCQSEQKGLFKFPSTVRWCSSTANASASSPADGSCQAVKTATYQYPRYPTVFSSGTAAVTATPATAAFTVKTMTGCNGQRKMGLQAVMVNNVNILTSPTGLVQTESALASEIRDHIGNGYSASGSSNSITISAPLSSGAITYTLTFTRTSTSDVKCEVTFDPAAPAFSAYRAGAAAVVVPNAGSFVRTDIVPSITSYAYPGSATRANTRTDCAGTTCTYAEEMTNFANWWAYYHTRMQMAKSSTSIAFGNIGERYRVGYFTINRPADSAHALDIATFNGTQKDAWYARLFAAIPGDNTPLREALTRAGRIYAGKLTSSPGGADPVEYACQQNFTILTTDGYWNSSSSGTRIDGTTAIGDADAALARPQYDGTGTSNTLADVAAYYYNTDLRTPDLNNCTGRAVAPATAGKDVCENIVATSGLDNAAHQHMSTFTVGFGISGYMQYSPSYKSEVSGDFFNVQNGTTANPGGGVCSWQTGGVCNWPVPANNTQPNIDDLWHAAVNSYGTYFSASNPASLSSGLANALSGVSMRTGASAAATTSNPNLVAEDNFLFSSTYTSVDWSGELNRQKINVSTGAVSATKDWSAQGQLDANAARVIYTYDPAVSSRLKRFAWNRLTTTEKAYFTAPAINGLSQFCTLGETCLSEAAKLDAAGANLVAFLTGTRTLEGAATDASKYYRQRVHLLGDIVSSEAAYVKTPTYNYVDSAYDAYKTANKSRQGMAYVAANDGMLHAFDADTGLEKWAYVPSMALPKMYKLADKNYGNLHSYLVDGTPNNADIYADGAWRTILVGGMNAGGRGYYALDVTDPAEPKALWEFTSDTSKGEGYTSDANLGYSFGKPEITKLKNGKWIVLLTSGYNNVPDSSYNSGDGGAYLYVLDAYTGEMITRIATGAGTVASPSGLAQIRGWADNTMLNNTVLRVYGGDMLGNLWRFDINGDIGAEGYDAHLLATLRDASGTPQPLTAKPELGDVNGNAVVYVGTGRYLGVTDLNDKSRQTIYAIKDTLGTTGQGNPRATSGFVAQTLTISTCPVVPPSSICAAGEPVRTSTQNVVDMSFNNGWYVDLPDTGERANTDPQLALGTLAITTNVPDSTACTVGGYSYFYFFDYRTGAPVATSSNLVVGKKLGNAIATRAVVAHLENNNVVGIVGMSDGSIKVPNMPVSFPRGPTRRVSWRELMIEN
jgi:type IV pilus assembly protein PilY1